ncbi:hypothetical protein BMS3Abin17_00272 [archaeon BMS3Abin17]|nr:hypothetical protein BMS3Abin17_00272 [archaeon BMS3Abin17]
MPQDIFFRRKQDILSKQDKSSKGCYDKRIAKLCEKINSLENYYTTSSCAGRVVIMVDEDRKKKGLFVNVYHDLIDFKSLKKDLIEASKKNKKLIKFKQEPCILHVACRSLEDAKEVYEKAKLVGWKRSGIISSGKRFVVEMISTEKLEFPIIESGKILVDDVFLKIIVRESNKNLKKSWEKIEKLRKLINRNI